MRNTFSLVKEFKGRFVKFSENCYAPSRLLRKALPEGKIKGIFKNISRPEDNFYWSPKRNPLSLEYLNQSFVWYFLLKKIKFKGKKVSEFCPGDSEVLPLALSYMGFKGSFYKIDKKVFKTNKIKKHFRSINLKVDIFKEYEKIPVSDLLIINHALDDLFIGLWDDKHGKKYFDFGHRHSMSEDKGFWADAIKEKSKYIPVLNNFFNILPKKINSKGYIIIRMYPSSFEVYNNLYKRINFGARLNEALISMLLRENFSKIRFEDKKIRHIIGNNSFVILQKN